MPATTALGGLPYPVGADPIDIAGDVQRLASAVDPKLIPMFTSVADRDTKWPTPPEGARCMVAYGTTGSLDFLRYQGTWRPRGLMLLANLVHNQSIQPDQAWWTLSYMTPSRNVATAWANNTWTAPVNGEVRVSAACAVMIGTTAGGYDAIGDYHITLGVTLRSTPLNIGLFRGRGSIISVGGVTTQVVNANDTIQIQVNVDLASGKYKTVAGGINDSRQVHIEYV